jgi:beta-1,4-mannosyl-glycoprotein beta-1,4-N-acetylglucosaminyltransferase
VAVYSCCSFFSEFDLLDLKIAEELDVIDKLVLAEADMTHQGAPKPLHLKGNPRYRHPKIELVFVTDGFGEDTWRNENLQRDALLQPFEDDDVFIVGDVDEINKKEDIPNIVEQARAHGHVRLEQTLYCYKINLMVENYPWRRAFAVSGRYLRASGKRLSEIRTSIPDGIPISTHGKHFSYLFDPNGISQKIKSFAHAEYNQPQYVDPNEIERRIAERVDPFDHGRELVRVELDDSYPSTILNNLEFWRKHIC